MLVLLHAFIHYCTCFLDFYCHIPTSFNNSCFTGFSLHTRLQIQSLTARVSLYAIMTTTYMHMKLHVYVILRGPTKIKVKVNTCTNSVLGCLKNGR